MQYFFRFSFIINEHRSPFQLKSKKRDFIEALRFLFVLLKCFWETGWWCIELYHHDLNAWMFCCVNSMWFGSFSFNPLNIICASFHSFEFFLFSVLKWWSYLTALRADEGNSIIFHWIHKLLISQRVSRLTMKSGTKRWERRKMKAFAI